jgi:FixJ family two-component response regulator
MNLQQTPIICVIDSDPAVLKAITRLLRISGYIVSGYSSSAEFLGDVEDPTCVIVDISMPGSNGLELQRVLKNMGRRVPMIFLTGRYELTDAVRAMKAGAVDFLQKPVSVRDLLNAVREAVVRMQEHRAETIDTQEVVRRFHTLTARERQVFEGIFSGRLNKQIAADLGIVEKTIKVHRGRVMRKMHARTLAELVRMGSKLPPKAPQESTTTSANAQRELGQG